MTKAKKRKKRGPRNKEKQNGSVSGSSPDETVRDSKLAKKSTCSDISDLLESARSALFEEMAQPQHGSPPKGMGSQPQIHPNFSNELPSLSYPVANMTQGGIQPHFSNNLPFPNLGNAAMTQGFMQTGRGETRVETAINEVLNRMKGIETKLTKLDSIEGTLKSVTNRLSDLETRMSGLRDSLKAEIQELKRDNREQRRDFDQLEESVNELLAGEQKQLELENEVRDLRQANKMMDEKVIDLQCRSMRDNLVFTGIPEPEPATTDRMGEDKQDAPKTEAEDVEKTLQTFLKTEMGFEDDIACERVHRMGRPRRDNQPRAIVAKFTRYKDRESVRKAAPSKLRGKTFGVNEQFPREIMEDRKLLLPKMKQARAQGQKAVLIGNKLYINNSLYVEKDDSENFRSDPRMGAGMGDRRKGGPWRLREQSDGNRR